MQAEWFLTGSIQPGEESGRAWVFTDFPRSCHPLSEWKGIDMQVERVVQHPHPSDEGRAGAVPGAQLTLG